MSALKLFVRWLDPAALVAPVTDRLWQLRQRLSGKGGEVWYAGDHPPTRGRGWWRLRG